MTSSAAVIVAGETWRQVDQHAEPVHLADDLAPERAQAPMAGGIERRVGPVGGDVVREGQVARAQGIADAQHAERVLDRVAALHPDQRGDPTPAELALDIVGGERERQAVRIAGDDPARQCRSAPAARGRSRFLDVAGQKDRPDLRADLSAREALEIGMAGGGLSQIVRRHVHRRLAVRPDAPGEIVVTVDERNGPKQATDAGQGASRSRAVPLTSRFSFVSRTSSGRCTNSGQIVRSYS